MSRLFWLGAVLAGVFSLGPVAQAQQSPSVDMGMTYSPERGKIATVNCGCIWLQGGSMDAAITFASGFGVAVNLTGKPNAAIGSGVNLSEISFMAGLRYTAQTHRWTDHFLGSRHRSSVFGEALFGVAHGFDGAFPSPSGIASSVNASSLQLGGGLNVGLAKGFGARAFELDYVRTTIPNGGNNVQNNLRLSFGITYHLHGR